MGRVLVACEESQCVCTAFRERGHEAYSCDILECSGGHPEWHILGDVLPILEGHCQVTTMDGATHDVPGRWDLIIAHPPCTYLSSVGASRLFNADHSVKDHGREEMGWQAKDFFETIYKANCDLIAIENPAPLKHFGLPHYNQVIEPYQFGHTWKKRTCLWLKGLPTLEPTKIVRPTGCWTVSGGGSTCRIKLKGKGGAKSQRERAKTFTGIAQAMADQWGPIIEKED